MYKLHKNNFGLKIEKKILEKIHTNPTFRVYQNTYSKRVIYEKVKNNFRVRV
jgi:hypothetical protein